MIIRFRYINMIKKYFNSVLSAVLCLLLSSCTESCNEKYIDITIYNISSEAVYVTFVTSTVPSYIIKSKEFNSKDLYFELKPSEKYSFRRPEEQLHGSKLHVLMIKSSTMDQYDNKAFYEAEDICDKRFILSYDDLEKMNYIIVFKDDNHDD